MEIANFIVIDDSTKRCREDNEIFKHTVNGTVFMPIGVTLPVIRKGHGCQGLGVVTELRITSTSTTMFFKIYNCAPEAGNAYYSLYRNQLTTSASALDDVYDNTDVIIPGALQNVKPVPNHTKLGHDTSYSRQRGYSSLSDFDGMDSDDVHW